MHPEIECATTRDAVIAWREADQRRRGRAPGDYLLAVSLVGLAAITAVAVAFIGEADFSAGLDWLARIRWASS